MKDEHMYMLEPEIIKDTNYFSGVAKFYAEGVKGFKYAAKLEVTGGQKCALFLTAYAETEGALTGCYYRILDIIERSIKVKEYLVEKPIIVKGDYVIGDKRDKRLSDL